MALVLCAKVVVCAVRASESQSNYINVTTADLSAQLTIHFFLRTAPRILLCRPFKMLTSLAGESQCLGSARYAAIFLFQCLGNQPRFEMIDLLFESASHQIIKSVA